MNENETECQALARKMTGYGEARGWSLAKLCREFPALGSERTLRDMRDGRFEGYDLTARLADLRAAAALAEELAEEQGERGEATYDSLLIVEAVRRACLTAMRSWGSNRVVVVQGPSGVGKTTALRIVSGKYGRRIATVEASDAWGDKPAALLRAILRALGHEGNLPASTVDRLEAVQETLTRSRTCVCIDEAHHLGPHCLNTVKTLVNTTPGEFVLLAIPTLWNKLESQAYMEARQLTTNRLSERLKLSLTERDLARYFALARPDAFPEGEKGKAARTAAKMAMQVAPGAGNMAFVRDLSRLLPGGEAATPELVAAALKDAAARR
ncbi:MAG: ATP-binding protein [Kiritimatiellae bacterium]|nr:ATP-binding protein [Kiritimatiellia bacterium]